MARFVLRGRVTDKPEPYSYEAFRDVPAGTSYKLRVREEGNENQAALEVRVTGEQFDSVAIGDQVEAPVTATAKRTEQRDGRVFADLIVRVMKDHQLAALKSGVRAAS